MIAHLTPVMYGRPRVGKVQIGGIGIGMERSCIRPLLRLETAGPQG
jgi:hypothetical protein